MQQLDIATYIVKPGETVTVEVEAVKVANFEAYTVDGTVRDPVSESPRTYEFRVTRPPGSQHHTTLTYVFPDDAPDDAEYRTTVSGDEGGSFTGPNIFKSDNVDHCDINFRCRS